MRIDHKPEVFVTPQPHGIATVCNSCHKQEHVHIKVPTIHHEGKTGGNYNSVPGPVVGIGLPGIILATAMLGLLLLARRRRKNALDSL